MTTLRLENLASDLYLEALRSSESVDTLHSLEIDCTAAQDALALSALLLKAGPHVEHLAIDLSQYLLIDQFGDDSEDVEVPGEWRAPSCRIAIA